MKICTTYHKTKDFSQFAKFKQGKDGLEYRCKLCRSAQRKEYCRKNKEKTLAKNKACNYNNLQPLWAEDNLKKN